MQHLCYFVWVATSHNFLATSTLKFDVKVWAVETLRLWKSAAAPVCHLVHLQLNSSSHRSIPQNMRCIWAAWRQNGSIVSGMKGENERDPQRCLVICTSTNSIWMYVRSCIHVKSEQITKQYQIIFCALKSVKWHLNSLLYVLSYQQNGIFETQLIPRVACGHQSLALRNRSCVSWKCFMIGFSIM